MGVTDNPMAPKQKDKESGVAKIKQPKGENGEQECQVLGAVRRVTGYVCLVKDYQILRDRKQRPQEGGK